MREKVFSKIASFVTRRALLTVVVAVLVTVAAGAVAWGLSIRMDWVDMLPEDHEMVESFQNVTDELGGTDYLIVMISDEPDESAALG